MASLAHRSSTKTWSISEAWTFAGEAYTKNRLQYLKADDNYRDDIGTLLPSAEKILDLYQALGAVFSTPAYDGQLLIFTTYDGVVYALKQP